MQSPSHHQPQVADAHPDLGATFIELLVSIVLLGTAGVAVLAALSTAATGAATNRTIAEVQASLATAGDAMTVADADNAQFVYEPCATPSTQAYVDAVADAAPGVTVRTVDYWSGSAWSDTCNYAAGQRLQRVTLAMNLDGVERTLSVVKRPALDPTADLGTPSPSAGGGGTGNAPVTPTPGL